MSKVVLFTATLLACAATLSSKDKYPKVTFHEMALNMQDAFSCGLVVEQHLHGWLKDKPTDYSEERAKYNCAHVESILNTLNDQDGGPPAGSDTPQAPK